MFIAFIYFYYYHYWIYFPTFVVYIYVRECVCTWVYTNILLGFTGCAHLKCDLGNGGKYTGAGKVARSSVRDRGKFGRQAPIGEYEGGSNICFVFMTRI